MVARRQGAFVDGCQVRQRGYADEPYAVDGFDIRVCCGNDDSAHILRSEMAYEFGQVFDALDAPAAMPVSIVVEAADQGRMVEQRFVQDTVGAQDAGARPCACWRA